MMMRLACVQDVSGGRPKRLSGTDLPIWGMEIDPEAARDEMRAARAASGNSGDSQLKNVLGPLGMGGLADQIGDLKLGACLEHVPETPLLSERDSKLSSQKLGAFGIASRQG